MDNHGIAAGVRSRGQRGVIDPDLNGSVNTHTQDAKQKTLVQFWQQEQNMKYKYKVGVNDPDLGESYG